MEHLQTKTSIVYLLWGTNAKEVKPLIKLDDNLVLEACHPIAQRYSGGKKMFVGCDHFKLANAYLGKREINW